MRFDHFKFLILEAQASFKYNDEHAHVAMWNHVVKNSRMRRAIEDGDFDTVQDWIEDEIEDANNDENHPLHFNKVTDSGFTTNRGNEGPFQEPLNLPKGTLGKKRPEHKDHYDQRVGESVWGIMALLKSREGRSAASKGLPARLTGTSKVDSNKPGWEGEDRTKKRDWEIYDENNPKFGIGISQKDLGGSQLMSGEAAQTISTLRAGAKNYALQQMKDGKWTRRQATEFKNKIEAESQSIGQELERMRGGTTGDKRGSRNVVTDRLRKLNTDYPGFNDSVGRETGSGEQQQGKSVSAGEGGAQLTINTGGPNASVVPTTKRGVANKPLRGGLPKGSGRPGNVRQDTRKQEYGTPPERRPRPSNEDPNQLSLNISQNVEDEIEQRRNDNKRTGPFWRRREIFLRTQQNGQNGQPAKEDKYLKLSQGMKTFSEFVLECSQLDEGGLSRLVSQSKKKGVAVLSGTRGDKSSKENKARNQQLVKDIRGKGLPGPTKAKGKWEGGSERSHIVTSGKHGKRAFKDKIKGLGKKYDQDAVITQSPGKSATLTRTRKDGMDKKSKSIGKMRPGKSNPKNETQIKGKTFTYEK